MWCGHQKKKKKIGKFHSNKFQWAEWQPPKSLVLSPRNLGMLPYVVKFLQVWLMFSRESWIIWVGSENHHTSLYKREADRFRHRQETTKRGCECLQPPGAVRRRRPLKSSERQQTCQHWLQPNKTDFKLLNSRTLREYISFLLSHWVCDSLLQWPWETNTWCWQDSSKDTKIRDFPGGLVVKTMLLLQGAQVWFLFRELRSNMPHVTAKKKKEISGQKYAKKWYVHSIKV